MWRLPSQMPWWIIGFLSVVFALCILFAIGPMLPATAWWYLFGGLELLYVAQELRLAWRKYKDVPLQLQFSLRHLCSFVAISSVFFAIAISTSDLIGLGLLVLAAFLARLSWRLQHPLKMVVAFMRAHTG